MTHRAIARPGLASILMAVALAVVLATPAYAGFSEWGTKNCGGLIAYVHGRYNDVADFLPPGLGTWTLYRENDGSWHTHERNGTYSGFWQVDAEPSLDFGNTWAGCRNYG